MPYPFIVENKEMAEIDSITQNKLGIPSLLLMEEAGLKTWLLFKKKIPQLFKRKLFFFIGSGNNGGDGLVVGRQAVLENHPHVYILYYPGKTQSNQNNFNYLKKLINPHFNHNHFFSMNNFKQNKNKIKRLISSPSILIDAIFGIGFQKRNNAFPPVMKWINQLQTPWLKVISLDTPSGLGEQVNPQKIIKANWTITYGSYKKLFFYPCYYEKRGKLSLINPGFPHFLLQQYHQHTLLTFQRPPFNIKLKKKDFKNSRGQVFILGGSKKYLGAPILAGTAAFKTVSGLVTLITRKKDYSFLISKSNNLIINFIENFEFNFKKKNALLIGPGLGKQEKDQEIVAFFNQLISKKKIPPVVFDADGLLWFKKHALTFKKLIKKKFTSIILTPHMGEMAKLTNTTTQEINRNPYYWGEQICQKYQVHLVLKSHLTYVFSPCSVHSKSKPLMATLDYPNPSLAIGGSGDILGGIIASLLGYYNNDKITNQKEELLTNNLFSIITTGVLIHSLTGQLAGQQLKNYTAEELIAFIPQAIKQLNAHHQHHSKTITFKKKSKAFKGER